MPAYLLHVRSAISFRHIEADLDDFEQRFIPDNHYVLSREGHTANYVVVPDRELGTFFDFLQKGAAGLRLDRLSLVQIGRSFRATEQGCSDPYAVDACGEWRRVRMEDSFEAEEVRVRTGVMTWLRKNARDSRDLARPAIGLFLYFHEKLEEDSRWLAKLKDALGDSTRSHMRDTHSVLLTTLAAGLAPDQLFGSKRYRRYLESGLIHTAFCFTIGHREVHSAGKLQSVLPPPSDSIQAFSPPPPFTPIIVSGGRGRSAAELQRIKASVAKLGIRRPGR